jgi:hypothetical protein
VQPRKENIIVDPLQNNIRKIRARLVQFRCVEIGAEVLYGMLRFASLGGILCLIWGALDNGWHLSNAWRWLGFLTLFGGIVSLGWQVWKACMKLRDFTQLALRLESQNGHAQNWVVNAFHFSLLKNLSPSSLEAWVITQTAEDILEFQVGQKFSWPALKNKILLPGIVGIGVLTYGLLWPSYFLNGVARLVFPWASIAPHTRVAIDQDFQNQSVEYGQSLLLDFGIRRGKAKEATLSFRKNLDEGLEEEKILLANAQDRFHFEFPALRKNLQWQLRVGDFETGPLHVKVLAPPELVNGKLSAQYPKELDRPNQSSILVDSMAYPEGTQLYLALELDQPVSQLEAAGIFPEKKIALSSQDKKNWETQFLLKQAVSLDFFYKTESGRSGVLSRNFHLQSIPDLPPRVEWKEGTEMRILQRVEEPFAIGVCGSDDRGIRSLALLFRKKGETPWNVFEENEGGGRKELAKSWPLSAKSLGGKSGMEFELQTSMKDGHQDEALRLTHISHTPTVTLSFLSKTECYFSLVGEIFTFFQECRQSLLEIYMMRDPSFSSPVLSFWEKRLEALNRLKKEIEHLGIPSLYFASLPGRLAKASSLLKDYQRSPSSVVMKRWMSEFLEIQRDWESEKYPLLNTLLQKALEEERSRLQELFAGCLQGTADKNMLVWEGQGIVHALEDFWKKGAPLLRKNLSYVRTKLKALRSEATLQRVVEFLNAEKKNEAQSLFQEWVAQLDLILKNSGSPTNHGEALATGEWIQALEKIVSSLERTDQRMGALLLNKNVSLDLWMEAVSWIEKSIHVQIEGISVLQSADPSLGIQGVTVLRAAQFDLQELSSWFRAGDLLKAASKLKKVRQGLKVCLTLLKKHLKELPKFPKTPSPTPPSQRYPPKIHWLNPEPLLLLSSQAVLNLKAVCMDDWGIQQIWLLTRILDANGVQLRKKESLWLETLDFPEKFTLQEKLSLSTLGIKDRDIVEIQIKCVDGDPNDFKESISPALKIIICDTTEDVSADNYFRFKSSVAEALQKFLEALQFLSQDLQNFEKEALQKKESVPSLFDACAERQFLLSKRFETILEKMDLFQKQSSHFPEEDFIKHLQWAKSTLQKKFEDWKQGTQQIQTLLHHPLDDFSPLLALFFQNLAFCNELQKDFKRLLDFFGTSFAPQTAIQNMGTALCQELTHIKNLESKEVPGTLQKVEQWVESLQSFGKDSKPSVLQNTTDVLDESALDGWQRLSLANHKLQLLEPLFSNLKNLSEWNNQDVEYFQSLCALLSIFRHQLQTLKNHIQNNSNTTEKEKQSALEAKTELRLSALENSIAALKTQIQNSAWQFEQEHLPQIQKETRAFLSLPSGAHSAQELFSLWQQKWPLWDQSVSTLQEIREHGDSASLETLKIQTQELLRLFETPYQTLLPPHFAEDLLNHLAFLQKALQNPNMVFIFLEKVEASCAEFRAIVSTFSEALTSVLYREAQVLQGAQTDQDNAALKSKTIQKRLETLTALLHRTPEQMQEMGILQKQWKEVQTEMKTLKKLIIHSIDSESIPRFQSSSTPEKSEEYSKLEFPALDASLAKMNEQTSGEPERLDQTILRNIAEELEELEAKRGLEESQKIKELSQRLSGITAQNAGETLSELKTHLENAQIQNAEKQHKQTLASVLQTLQQASENRVPSPEEKNTLVQERQFRYLSALKKKKEDWDRVQNRMSQAFLLTEGIQNNIQKHTLALEHQWKELRQTMDTPHFESVKAETQEILRHNETRLLQEADTVLQGRVSTALGFENSARPKSIPVVGFEILTREYLKVIAEQ